MRFGRNTHNAADQPALSYDLGTVEGQMLLRTFGVVDHAMRDGLMDLVEGSNVDVITRKRLSGRPVSGRTAGVPLAALPPLPAGEPALSSARTEQSYLVLTEDRVCGPATVVDGRYRLDTPDPWKPGYLLGVVTEFGDEVAQQLDVADIRAVKHQVSVLLGRSGVGGVIPERLI